MKRLSTVKEETANGRNLLKNVSWLIKTIEHQNTVIDHFQHKVSYHNYMKLSQSHLELEMELKRVQEQLSHYEQLFKGREYYEQQVL